MFRPKGAGFVPFAAGAFAKMKASFHLSQILLDQSGSKCSHSGKNFRLIIRHLKGLSHEQKTRETAPFFLFFVLVGCFKKGLETGNRRQNDD